MGNVVEQPLVYWWLAARRDGVGTTGEMCAELMSRLWLAARVRAYSRMALAAARTVAAAQA